MKDRFPSVLVGAAVYAVLGLIVAVLAVKGGQTGATVSGLLSCVLMLLVPMVAVWHHTSTNKTTISLGAGAGMGALSLIIGGAIAAGVQKVLQLIGTLPSDAEMMRIARAQMVQQGLTAEQMAPALSMAEMFQGPLGIAAGLLVAALVGAIGGLIGAAIFKKGSTDEDLYG